MSESRAVAVVDIDGVLADVTHRLHHVAKRPKNWDAFFAAASKDPLLPEGLAVAQELAERYDLTYLSGRPEKCRGDTEEWLRANGIPPGELLLRRPNDRRPARITKVEVLKRIAATRRVALLVDDDFEVCSAARAQGFTVLEARWGRPPNAQDDSGQIGLFTALTEAQEGEGRT
jgi:hypothetical protein